MKRTVAISILLTALTVTTLAFTRPETAPAIDVRVISDRGGEFPRYRTYPRVRGGGAYYYMEAVKGETYSIEVSNRSDRRVGVVIAVDGRNIISGDKSDLKNSERMYIIEPYATNTFEGWRTGMDRTNRFYFTGQSDSYAERVFADASAMGTIAVAAYREKVRELPQVSPSMKSRRSGSHGAGSQSHRDSKNSCDAEDAGTGFGSTAYSPARLVSFDPEKKIAGKIVLKYEWRSELCRKGIIQCGPGNRFWPDDMGFAPIPHDFLE